MIETILTVLGWEERFYEGLLRDIERFQCKCIHLIIYSEYNKFTADNLRKIENLCANTNIDFHKHYFSYQSSASTWRELEKFISINLKGIKKIALDISTMPRETIWSLLFFFKRYSIEINYIYYKPKVYGDWLCKEPDRPRLLYKHSGIAEFGKSIALVILTGYDYDRTNQLVRFYEPSLTLLGIQKGNQFDNQNRNIKESHEAECIGQTEVESFEIDAYNDDYGYNILAQKISSLKEKYNIIVASLGPKTSSIAVYKVFLKHPEIALAYVPTKEYNKTYSTGILDDVLFGEF